MSDYLRYFVPGGTYFFTLVTHNRVPLFESEIARTILGNAIRDCLRRNPVEVIAVVLLPEHLHTIWALPPGDDRYARRWWRIKREFTREWLARGGAEQNPTSSQLQEGRRGIWQRRFWEHTIRNDADLEAHFDYIHYNPVKHGHVQRPRDWPHSSFHRWAAAGHYNINWAASQSIPSLPGNAGE